MIPSARDALPDMMTFIMSLQGQYEAGRFTSWRDFIKPIRAWYTPQRLQQIDAIVYQWEQMASYADQQTLIHLNAVLVALFGLDDYQALSPADQNLALWIVLYHDVAKQPHPHQRDHVHAFRSAVSCGKGLMKLGFVESSDTTARNTWYETTHNAITYDEKQTTWVQDNRQLPAIMAGIDTLFGGRDSSAGLIVCGVLFHMGLNVVDDFPQANPLTDDDIQAYLTPRLLPLLQVMMRADSLAWALFDVDRQAPEREQTLSEFRRVAGLLGIA